MSILIRLNVDEMVAAATIGAHRNIACLRAGSPDTNFPDPEGRRWSQHIEAAGAELAVSKWRNRYWWGLAGPHAANDAAHFQVRHTPHESGHLIVRARDSDEDAFVLVVGKAPAYRIVGWIRADAKTDAYRATNKRDPRPYWQVPQSALRSIYTEAAA